MRLEGRDLARLRDIDIYASRALEYLTLAGSDTPGTLVQDVILRCFDVIGEAARATNPEVRAAYPAIP